MKRMISRPNAKRHNPSPDSLRAMFHRFRELGRSRKWVCAQIGVPYRTMGDYLNPKCQTSIDYCTLYTIEALLQWETAMYGEKVRDRLWDRSENRRVH